MAIDKMVLSQSVANEDADFLSRFYPIDETADWRLDLKDDCYQLQHINHRLSLSIDFRIGHYRHRNRHTGKEPLLRAIKIKQKLPQQIIDTTPGVLKDSFMLSGRGIKVIAIERSPILYVMVKRALAQTDSRIHYVFADAIDTLSAYTGEIIYLDPMYPAKKKSARVRKEMQMLHDLVGSDTDADQLLASARAHASTINARVVVKRPRYAAPLGGQQPSFTAQTKTTRFDIYL
ncbi:MAG: 16S rRNA methyltransferase [Gammaproteobacteria bacterium]|nr:MAG: 16S rRNA methyltransferase [Gammaproteobacteria bacterium]